MNLNDEQNELKILSDLYDLTADLDYEFIQALSGIKLEKQC